MLVINKRPFYTGLVMAMAFAVVLALMFMPLVNGRNILDAADDLFNSVAKQSSYYIPELREHAKKYDAAAPVDVKLTGFPDAEVARNAAAVLTADGAQATASGSVVSLKGNLGRLLNGALDDSDAVFNNRGEAVQKAHGLEARQVMYARWLALKGMNKELKAKSEFEKASAVEEVVSKGVEVAYNFYGIVPKAASANVAILGASLLFYLVYTMWWGYAIMWMCDGIGLQMKASGKRQH